MDYIVVEQICELCSEINSHYTSHCPHLDCGEPWSFPSLDRLLAFVTDRIGVLMFLAGQMAR
jgi:hypothetical protein